MAGVLNTIKPRAASTVPPIAPITHGPNTEILRTAAYCRVSTDLEIQEGSYEVQTDYYLEKISNDPKLELVGIYGDKGKSGLKAASRPGFQQMIADCEAGKIDLILTKSISRFARSMADCVDLIQKLRAMNVVISFEREGLRTDNRKADLFMNIFAALAQEESHSISQNMVRSYDQYAAEGRPYGRASYGYRYDENNEWSIEPNEAKRVQTAFNMAAEGYTYNEIRAALDKIEDEEGTGVVWLQKRLRYMLRNITYVGDYYSHRTVCITPGHQVMNRGYRDRYYIEEHHEPIVTRALFDRVQQMLDAGILISYMPRNEAQERMVADSSWREVS